MRSPSESASARRLSATIPHPSPRTKPSAAASKALQRPSVAIMRALESMMNVLGERIKLTPPASAIRHSFARRL